MCKQLVVRILQFSYSYISAIIASLNMSFETEGYSSYRKQSITSHRSSLSREENIEDAMVLKNCRRPSLREQPSYREEVVKALNRREELAKLKERLSSSRDLLAADPSTKPWMKTRTRRISSEVVKEDDNAPQYRRILKPDSPPRRVSETSASSYYYGARRNMSVCDSISSGGSEY
ncbi:uncharacterized protein [Lepeophtheirus salmonis]|uniref:uncharacterized protein n=1 Tax=Lepeophtheirus salmonis TaxID=72036 RepID=UPI001AE9F54A|nr:uncharacterized protein LOC121117082 [Lepeophtheirus salmonis]